jgi:hypothetical protein
MRSTAYGQFGRADRELGHRSDSSVTLEQVAPAEHEERLEWLGLADASQFSPDSFDLHEVNHRLRGV